MLTANYTRHLKVLGKLCKFYDEANAEESEQLLRLARLVDQVATGEVASQDGFEVIHQNYSQLKGAITSGPTAMKTSAINAAAQYVKMEDFYGDFVSETPANTTTALAILTAFAAEMVADNVSFDTKSSTGLINFFDTVAGSDLSWNESSDPDYPDATYVVDELV